MPRAGCTAGPTTLWVALIGVTCSGCLTQNPSYFPHLLPAGRITRTHARPAGHGAFADFDPYACRVEVRPLESTGPVRGQQVLIATVYDGDNKPRRKRRVEWLLEGVGQIVEVDESGISSARGYKVDNRYAVSYTDYFEHVIDRGNDDPSDDFCIRPGQTWCVISSAVPGDTFVTAFVPAINDWNHNRVVITRHWVDATWQLPPNGTVRYGSEHPLPTTLARSSDLKPQAGYKVRYRILDGPPAVLLPPPDLDGTRTVSAEAGVQEIVLTSGPNGLVAPRLAQTAPANGMTRVAVEVLRPTDPATPDAPQVVIGRGETVITWQSPRLEAVLETPETADSSQPFTLRLTVRNAGAVESPPSSVQLALPEGLLPDQVTPLAEARAGGLAWNVPALPANGQQVYTVVVKPQRTGAVVMTALAEGPGGLRSEAKGETLVTSGQLRLTLDGPSAVPTGEMVDYRMTVSNAGNGPATNVVLLARFDDGLEHETKRNPLELSLGRLEPGESRDVPLRLKTIKEGSFVTTAGAVIDGALTSRAIHTVKVQAAGLLLDLTGPTKRYTDRDGTWELRVRNVGALPLHDVVVRDRLPPELSFRSATAGGRFENGEVIWSLGTLAPGEQRPLQLTATATAVAARAVQTVTATAGPVSQRTEQAVEILALPAVHMDAMVAEPVVRVGSRARFTVLVTNRGASPERDVVVTGLFPRELTPVGGEGPQPGRVTANAVTFPAVASVGPGETVRYTLEADARTVGDVRFRAEMVTGHLTVPVASEAGVRVVGGQ